MINPIKAIVTEIKYAGLTFSGLMMPDSSYGISVPQANELFAFSSIQNTASRDLKRLLGKEFHPSKISTESGTAKQNVIRLEDFSKLVMLLAFKGNPAAQKFALASVTEKLERIFDTAFGVEIDEREREQRFAARLMTKATFRPLTDELQRCGFTEGWQYGKYISKFQAIIGFEDGTRDKLPLETLLMLGNCQAELKILMRSGYTPEEALTVWQENR